MNSTSTELREWASRCEDMAASARTEKERESLLRKAEGLRALANSEDWLEGRTVNSANSEMPELPTIKSLAAE